MTWADYAILAILGTSALLSLFRGFVREALALVGWVGAFWLAMTFGEDVAGLLASTIDVPSVRLGAGYVLVFVAVLVVTAIIVFLVGLLIDSTGLSATDRMFGVLFGLARGAAIVSLLVLLAGFTAMPRDPWWREALLIPHFESLAVTVRDMLPPEIAEHLTYEGVAASLPARLPPPPPPRTPSS
jgi:membrane protein required for colicin V production